jgi:ATP-dependent exoDNAse (exonuclease V) beta subunit
VIEGQVDLWGRAPSGEVWIVDYKTGSPEMKDKAFDQMALYAMALRKSKLVKDDEPIHLAAVFPFAEKIFTAHAPTNSEIRTKFSS